MLENYRTLYQSTCKRNGDADSTALRQGADLAIQLRRMCHSIEAQRLLTSLAVTSKRVHGPNHDITKAIQSRLDVIKERRIMMVYQNKGKLFQAMSYEVGGKLVLQGPLTNPRNRWNELTSTMDPSLVSFMPGTPVVCHGLNSSTRFSHLSIDGKIGELRCLDKDTRCWRVCFEDASIGKCLVPQKYLRILFELPEKQGN